MTIILCDNVTAVPNRQLHSPYLPSRVNMSLRLRTMFLETVWSAIPELEWETPEALKKTSGLDEGTLKRTVDFLVRWEFVEVRQYPGTQIRRKPGALSPVEIASALRSIGDAKPQTTSGRVRIATRVACRACGHRNLTLSGNNEVECATCHEKQWFALEIDKATMKLEDAETPIRPGILRRMLVRLGFPQPAFRRYVPNALQYFWFWCTECSRVSADYPHGYSRYMTCEFCGCNSGF
jgi:hypothetical protein